MFPDKTADNARKAVVWATAGEQEAQIRRLATALVKETNADPKSVTKIADLTQFEHARAAVNHMLKRLETRRPGVDTSIEIFTYATLLATLARHHVGVPKEDVDRLRQLAKGLKPKNAHQMTPKNRSLQRKLDEDQIVAALLYAPERTFNKLLAKSRLSQSDCCRLQAALLTAMLPVAPVRPKNAAMTRLGHNLICSPDFRDVRLYYPPEEVKNNVELEFEITGATKELLIKYLEQVRPLMTDDDNPYLFPGKKGPKGAAHLSGQIARYIESEVGIRITAHQFRHVAAYLFLQQNPGNYEPVRRFLGHIKISTTVDYYAEMEQRKAGRLLDNHVARRRAELVSKAPRGRRGRRK